MAPTPTLQELLDIVRQDAPTDDALDQLTTASATVADLSEVGDGVLGHYVDRARRAGYSWTEISTALGVTKQAAHKRFAASAAAARPPLDRFTDRARHVLREAPAVARSLGHPYVGTEHLLLGLYAEPEGIAALVLSGAGISREAAEESVLRRAPRRDDIPQGPLPHTPRAAAVIEGTVPEALHLGHNYIGTEHLLLALYADPVAARIDDESAYREGGGVATEALIELGLDHETARDRILDALSRLRRGGDS